LRYERRLHKNALVNEFPKLAQVPLADTGLPMKSCLRDVLLRGREVIRWNLESRGLAESWALEESLSGLQSLVSDRVEKMDRGDTVKSKIPGAWIF